MKSTVRDCADYYVDVIVVSGSYKHSRADLVSRQHNTGRICRNRTVTIGSGLRSADHSNVTYHITFGCYGHQLHGEERGSVDRLHNLPGSRFVGSDPERLLSEIKAMHQAPYIVDRTRREVVLKAIIARCDQNGWMLLAAHARTNHVHVVVDGKVAPERIMNALKSYSSRCLNQSGLDESSRKRWARHGSTRYLWEHKELSAAIVHVVGRQGDAMAVFEA